MNEAGNLRKITESMMFGQVMTGFHEGYNMADLPDAAAAVEKAGKSAVAVGEVAKLAQDCMDKNGMLKGDIEDAKSSLMAVFLLAQRLTVESHTAVRLLAREEARASSRSSTSTVSVS